MTCPQRRWAWFMGVLLIVSCLIFVYIDVIGDTLKESVDSSAEIFTEKSSSSRRISDDGPAEGKTTETTPPRATVAVLAGFLDLENLDREKALVLGHRRKDRGILTIGITTVKRDNASYLQQTLSSLIDSASPEERSQIRLVVFACDFEDKARQEARDVVSKFPEHVQSGLLQVIEAPRSFYPSFENMKQTFDNLPKRVLWRSKENLDNVFLFTYCFNMSDYYLQMDDDFTTKKEYLKIIRDFIEAHRGDRWILLDISEKGTGVLFQNSDLPHVSRFLTSFYQEQPVDLLLGQLLNLHRQPRHFVVTPPLFYHLGQISSLDLKNKKHIV